MSDYVRPEYTPLFREVQDTIAGYLNEDPQISAKHIEFIPETKLDIDFEVKKALGQQGIVGIVNTLKGTFAGHDGCTNAWQIEAEVDVIENPPVRRSQLKKLGLSTGTVSDILDWVQESICGPSSPTFSKFSPVSQEIGQSNGLVVGRSIMRTLVLADTSAVISTENQWVCPYALRAELSALYDDIGELSSELSSIPQTTDVQLSSAWHLSPWDGDRKMVQEFVFSPDGGMIETPSGDYWACDRLELTKDGQATELTLTLNKQYNVDGEGNMTVQSPAASFNPNPYIVEVGNKSLELQFKIDGAGVYGVCVADAQTHSLVAEQPDHQQYSFCDLEFDYNGSHFTIKAKKDYRLFIPSSEFIRDSMASNPGMEFYNIMSQMYLPLSGGNVNGNLSVGTGVVLEQDLGGGILKVSDGHGNWTWYQGNWISHNGSNFMYPTPEQQNDYTLATQEWTDKNYSKISAMTEDEYEQITPDPTTLYVITED